MWFICMDVTFCLKKDRFRVIALLQQRSDATFINIYFLNMLFCSDEVIKYFVATDVVSVALKDI